MIDTVRLTYRELAERLGIEPDSARIKAKRHAKAGRWKLIPGNHPGATVMVELPAADLVRVALPVRTPTGAPEQTEDRTPERSSAEVQALQDHIKTLRELLEQKDAAHAVDLVRLLEKVEQLESDLQEARADADHAKTDQVRMARDVTTMFDELKALADRYTELHTDRARLQAELEQARRPWFRRWFGW